MFPQNDNLCHRLMVIATTAILRLYFYAKCREQNTVGHYAPSTICNMSTQRIYNIMLLVDLKTMKYKNLNMASRYIY